MSKRVFVDTNIIIEAFRINCWMSLCSSYAIETVEKCIEEARTGNPETHNHIKINDEKLYKGFADRHKANSLDIATLIDEYPNCQGLDDGELHLFAWLHAQKILPNPQLIISTADKAAIRAANEIGWIDQIKSLEELLQGSDKTKIKLLRQHFSVAWLKKIKTDFLLDKL